VSQYTDRLIEALRERNEFERKLEKIEGETP